MRGLIRIGVWGSRKKCMGRTQKSTGNDTLGLGKKWKT